MNIAINGFGRIGRAVFKNLIQSRPQLKIAAINDLAPAKTLAHLLKYDTVYGIYEKNITSSNTAIIADNQEIPVLGEKDPSQLPWQDLKIDIVLECTGIFTKREAAQKHLTAGARKVIISAPCQEESISTYVLGVNAHQYQDEAIISMGSCTTNCAAPVLKVLHDNFKIAQASLTTVHSYTATQSLVDGPKKSLRETRAAAQNIIPTITGAAISVIRALPELKGKLEALALRVPTICVSIIDITATTDKNAASEQVNDAFKQASANEMKNILSTSDQPLVSSDYIKNPYSAIVDLALTKTKQNFVKVAAWYDNEWAYACRLAEMAEFVLA